jgi:hypothetical protein
MDEYSYPGRRDSDYVDDGILSAELQYKPKPGVSGGMPNSHRAEQHGHGRCKCHICEVLIIQRGILHLKQCSNCNHYYFRAQNHRCQDVS